MRRPRLAAGCWQEAMDGPEIERRIVTLPMSERDFTSISRPSRRAIMGKKDAGAWSIPKGQYQEGDDPLATAKREFHEETGSEVTGSFRALSPLRQPSGKVVSAWAVEGDIEAATVKSNTFSLEWPPRSGKMLECPEVDRGAWFDLPIARTKLQPGQRGFLDQLQQLLGLPQSKT